MGSREPARRRGRSRSQRATTPSRSARTGSPRRSASTAASSWSTWSGKVRTAAGGSAGAPQWLLFSPDGETVVSTGLDGAVTLWDAETAAPRATLRGHSASVGQPVFSPDGATLYTASDDGTAIAWDINGTRRLGRPFTFTHDRAYDPAFDRHPGRFSPDGRLIAVGLKEKGIQLWDASRSDPGGRAPAGDRRRGQGARVQPGRANARSRHPRAAWRRSGMWSRDRSGTDRSTWRRSAAGGELQRGRDDARDGRFGRRELWNVATGAALGRIGEPRPPTMSPSARPGPSSRSLRREGGGGAIKIWDVARRSRIANAAGVRAWRRVRSSRLQSRRPHARDRRRRPARAPLGRPRPASSCASSSRTSAVC